MKIETKYEIGQHIWVIYEDKGEARVYDDYIGWITFEDELRYGTKESLETLSEEQIILYNDTETLIYRIKEYMRKIRERENNE
jgi:hypothetical protein